MQNPPGLWAVMFTNRGILTPEKVPRSVLHGFLLTRLDIGLIMVNLLTTYDILLFVPEA